MKIKQLIKEEINSFVNEIGSGDAEILPHHEIFFDISDNSDNYIENKNYIIKVDDKRENASMV